MNSEDNIVNSEYKNSLENITIPWEWIKTYSRIVIKQCSLIAVVPVDSTS
ncbi:MAG: hypothetical protein ISS33_06630 [Candidatus Omnitrophica bacterium]|nr:hypothetical protein [Candidatus Omnitrophota bacterium]